MEQNNNLPTTCQPEPAYHAPAPAPVPASYFTDMAAFEGAQRVAKMLAASDMVPNQYRNNVANTVLALEVALQTKSSPFFVMQNLNVIQGKPGWNAQFIAALLNSSGRFRGGLRYETDDDDNPTRCRVWAVEAATGERLNGPTVTLEMARKEGWTNRPGSKWQTMPEVMLGYRAVTFFGRRFAPDLLLGMRTDDELYDIGGPGPQTPPSTLNTPNSSAAAIDALIDAAAEPTAEESPEVADAVVDAEPANPQPDPLENLPPNLAKYLEERKGEAPRPIRPPEPEPEQAALPLTPAEPEQTPPSTLNTPLSQDYRQNAKVFLADIDSKTSLSELRWWTDKIGPDTLEGQLGGKDSEFYQQVMDRLRERTAKFEQKLKRK